MLRYNGRHALAFDRALSVKVHNGFNRYGESLWFRGGSLYNYGLEPPHYPVPAIRSRLRWAWAYDTWVPALRDYRMRLIAVATYGYRVTRKRRWKSDIFRMSKSLNGNHGWQSKNVYTA